MSSTMVKRQEANTSEMMRSGPSTRNALSFGARNSGSIGGSTGSVNQGSAWGSNIWAINGLTSSFDPNPRPSNPNVTSTKTGSGLLADTSVPDALDPVRPLNSTQSGHIASTSISQSRFSDAISSTRAAPPSSSSQFPTGTARNSQTYNSRPLPVNLNSTVSGPSRPDYEAPVTSSGFFGASEPPNVYTKFDRPSHGSSSRQLASDVSFWNDGSSMHSPLEDNRSSAPSVFPHQSMPASRNNSLPPSRQSDEAPAYPQFGGFTGDSYRRPSPAHFPTSSTTTSALSSQTDAFVPQFSQINLDGERRGSFARRPGTAVSGVSGVSLSHGIDHSGFVNQRQSNAQVDPTSSYTFGNNTQSSRPVSQYSAQEFYANANIQHDSGYVCTDNAFDTRMVPLHQGQSQARRDSAHSRELQMSTATFAMHQNLPVAPTDDRLRAFYFQQAMRDPQFAQMMIAQAQYNYLAYAPFNNQFANGARPCFGAPSGQMLVGMNQPVITAELQPGTGIRSTVLDEFKSNTKSSRRLELKDIYGHIAEFAGDQHGSRFIQTKLETANSDERERIFVEIYPNAVQLMKDVFGNYVIQKLFEHGDQSQKRMLASRMKGQVLSLALQCYGCRVVQKALEHILNDQQVELINELEHFVLKCVKDQNGNHVIQKAIERGPPSTVRSILDSFVGEVLVLSSHPYGCRVVQRCLENCDMSDKRTMMRELHTGMASLVGDQFGNYVVQHVVQHGSDVDRSLVLQIVASSFETFSRHKFASNVVEKCLFFGNDAWRKQVVDTLIAGSHRELESMILNLIRDQYGNYVIQKLLDVVSRADYVRLLHHLQPEIAQAKRAGCSKQVGAIEKKMHRFGPYCYNMQADQTHASRATSVGNTPPPLTSDTRSLQTSYPPSINSDAMEGATSSRKGSEPSSERSLIA